jgi:2-dehydro-3-deoxyphosphogluconate aldolase / (4S)-4-hydroxy-2-oxoglutarate aldolase
MIGRDRISSLIPSELETRIAACGIIAVLVIDDPDSAVPLARTLLDNGIAAMELTLRTDSAFESLRRVCEEVPEMLAGVGTILTTEQLAAAKAGGAAFGVAPGLNPAVVEKAKEMNFPFAPGVATPSEIERAVSMGCRIMKFFHAECMGGVKYLKGINSPYGHLGLKYIPLGGLSYSNMRDYLGMKEVLALGGSWIAPQDSIKRRDWTLIGRNAADAVAAFKGIRA